MEVNGTFAIHGIIYNLLIVMHLLPVNRDSLKRDFLLIDIYNLDPTRIHTCIKLL